MAAPGRVSTSDSGGSDRGILTDEKKRKRMESNRESARRSRIRKKIQLDELASQVSELKKEKTKLEYALCETRQCCLIVETENSVLRTRALELANRLEALKLILMQMDSVAADPFYMNQYNYC
ncbi:basic region/leucine zipper transcription factor 16 [Rhynchospora pubera]|uniref:Basic region/leucine zipper transcription factor 16 n=1 Tax=Rhynchospora pubera TaxID=906938 RepID=A0AAV8DUP6_9POAL|nr:basic region/leucine zipper transcription factor 16 [Rhynchospora pubera]